jgi:hypothetical protein
MSKWGYGWLEVKCRRCETRAIIPLDAVRRSRNTPVWKLEAALKCRSCWTPRYSPTEKWRELVCFDHPRFERFNIVRAAFYRAVPTGTLLRLC